jgi:hypothetical protein
MTRRGRGSDPVKNALKHAQKMADEAPVSRRVPGEALGPTRWRTETATNRAERRPDPTRTTFRE